MSVKSRIPQVRSKLPAPSSRISSQIQSRTKINRTLIAENIQISNQSDNSISTYGNESKDKSSKLKNLKGNAKQSLSGRSSNKNLNSDNLSTKVSDIGETSNTQNDESKMAPDLVAFERFKQSLPRKLIPESSSDLSKSRDRLSTLKFKSSSNSSTISYKRNEIKNSRSEDNTKKKPFKSNNEEAESCDFVQLKPVDSHLTKHRNKTVSKFSRLRCESENKSDASASDKIIGGKFGGRNLKMKKFQSIPQKKSYDVENNFVKIESAYQGVTPNHSSVESEQYFEGCFTHMNNRGGRSRRNKQPIKPSVPTKIVRPVIRPIASKTASSEDRVPHPYISTSSSRSLSNSTDENGTLLPDPSDEDDAEKSAFNSTFRVDTNHNLASLTESPHESTSDLSQIDVNREKIQERYLDILKNSEMINFGHWRMKQEGNYSPEEKYGFSERRLIRTTSFGSDEDKIVDPEVGKISDLNVDDVTKDRILARDLVADKFDVADKLVEHASNEDFQKQTEESTSGKTEETNRITEETNKKPENSNNTINCLLKGVLKKTKDKNVTPLEEHLKSDAISSDLQSRVDDCTSDCKIMKTALQQLHWCLEKEEDEKEKLNQKCKKLEKNNEILEEENNKLKELIRLKENESKIEMKKKDSKDVAVFVSSSIVDTSDSSSQTDQEIEKSSLDTIKLNLEMASQYIEKLKHVRTHYDETVEQTEKAIHDVLCDLQRT